MTTDNNQRYGRNRNIWRKVYSYGKQKPKIVTFVDTATSRSLEFDANQLQRHRDYFLIDDIHLQPTGALNYAEYDEGVIYFNGENFKAANYNFIFSGNPYVVYTLESAVPLSSSNINVYGISLPTSSSFVVGASAPLSGSVRYRAVYSQNVPSYPAYVVHGATPKINSPYTSSFIISAGGIATVGQTEYTASYTLPSSGTLEYRAESHDEVGDNSSDVALINQTFSSATSTNTISSVLTNKIHFMVTRQE